MQVYVVTYVFTYVHIHKYAYVYVFKVYQAFHVDMLIIRYTLFAELNTLLLISTANNNKNNNYAY